MHRHNSQKAFKHFIKSKAGSLLVHRFAPRFATGMLEGLR